MTRIYIKNELMDRLYAESRIDLLATDILSFDEEAKKYFIEPDALEDPSILRDHKCINNASSAANSALRAEIIYFLNEVTGSAYKPNTAATKRLINARVADGFTLDDFKRVILHKANEWKITRLKSSGVNPSATRAFIRRFVAAVLGL